MRPVRSARPAEHGAPGGGAQRRHAGAAGQSISEAMTAWGTLADDLEEIQIELPTIEIPKTD
jgi:hypothetical protein